MIRNFVIFDDAFMFNYSAAYADISQNLAVELFKRNNVKVRIDDIGTAEGCRYNVVLCRIRKKDMAGFLKSMKELAEEIPNYGYADYEDFCVRLSHIAEACAA